MTHARCSRPPSARILHDEALRGEIARVHEDSYSVLGVRKMHVMRGGATRDCRASRCRSRGPLYRRAAHGRPGPARHPSRQVPAHHAPREQCPADLVRRHFEAFAPGGLWVADIPPQAGGTPSYVRTFSGWVYVAFVTDVYSRRIIGWQTTYWPTCTDLALDALEMAVWQ